MAGEDEQENISQVEETVDDDNADKSQTTDATPTDRLIHLPLTRVKHIIKSDPDVSLASQEAVIMLSKACELFIQLFSKEAVHNTMHSKRKTLQRKDLVDSVDHNLRTLDGRSTFDGRGIIGGEEASSISLTNFCRNR